MNKRGQIGETIGAIILVGILILGGVGSYKIVSNNRYIGNTETQLVYDLKYCEANDMPKDKTVSFIDKEEAYRGGFKDAECNK